MVRNEKGVTLVELLIVIVILGIIAAISVPAVGNIVENAEKDALLGDATNLESAVDLYCTSEESPYDDSDPCDGNIYFSNDSEDELTEQTDDTEGDYVSLSGYLEDFEGDYLAYFEGDDLYIAIRDAEEEYSYIGPAEGAERADVEEGDDAWDGTETDAEGSSDFEGLNLVN